MTRADYDPTCSTCAHAIEHGWFGLLQGVSHCPRFNPRTASYCHATWQGFSVSHCAVCHRTFSSPSALERHRVPRGSTHCVDPEHLFTKDKNPVFTSFVNQYGTTIWRQAGSVAPWHDKETQ